MSECDNNTKAILRFASKLPKEEIRFLVRVLGACMLISTVLLTVLVGYPTGVVIAQWLKGNLNTINQKIVEKLD